MTLDDYSSRPAHKLYLSAKGRPFSDTDAAHRKAIVMSSETGEECEVVQHPDGGYAVIFKGPETSAEEVLIPRLPEDVISPYEKASVAPKPVPISQQTHSPEILERANRAPVKGENLGIKLKTCPSWFSFWLEMLGASIAVVALLSPLGVLTVLIGDQRVAQFENQLYLAHIIQVLAIGAIASLFLKAWITRLANRYIITDYEVISEIGLIRRKRDKVRLKDIRTVDVDQSVIDRLLGIGTLGFSSAGTDGVDVAFHRVYDPLKYEAIVLDLQRALGSSHD